MRTGRKKWKKWERRSKMADLIIGKTNVTKLIEEYISKQKDQWVFMLEVPEERYFDVNLETIKVLANKKKYSGLYISLHRPYKNLISLLKEKRISPTRHPIKY